MAASVRRADERSSLAPSWGPNCKVFCRYCSKNIVSDGPRAFGTHQKPQKIRQTTYEGHQRLPEEKTAVEGYVVSRSCKGIVNYLRRRFDKKKSKIGSNRLILVNLGALSPNLMAVSCDSCGKPFCLQQFFRRYVKRCTRKRVTGGAQNWRRRWASRLLLGSRGDAFSYVRLAEFRCESHRVMSCR